MHLKVLDEARAMILWGEPADSVRRLLLSNDLSGKEADQWIAEFTLERLKEIRRTGVWKIVTGIAALTVSGCGLSLIWPLMEETPKAGRIFGIPLSLLLFGILFGLWKLLDGLVYLVRPQLESKSISELSD